MTVPWGDAAFLLGNDGLGLDKGPGQLEEGGLHLVEVLDLFGVANGPHDAVELLIALLFGGTNGTLGILFVIAELETEKKDKLKKSAKLEKRTEIKPHVKNRFGTKVKYEEGTS